MKNTKIIYSRLVFNKNEWKRPSGNVGKSKNPNTHECEYGFGFEEWLFSDKHLLEDQKGDIYRYGYLEGIHKNYKPGDEYSTLILFTIFNRNRYIVAKIKNWKPVCLDESAFIIDENKDLIDEMRIQLKDVVPNFQNALYKFHRHVQNESHNSYTNFLQLFNIKFKSEDLELLDKNDPVYHGDVIYRYNRFWFYRQ